MEKQQGYRVTTKEEHKALDPKFLQHLGYVNRNVRPTSSKRKEILLQADDRRPTINPDSMQERRLREAKLTQQFRELAQRQAKSN